MEPCRRRVRVCGSVPAETVTMEDTVQELFSFGEFTTTVIFTGKAALEAELHDTALSVFDEHTAGLLALEPSKRVVLPAGESAKSWPQVERILERGFEEGLSRRDTIAGVGGGVVCDMTAFAASVYMRGCGLTLVPTTLLAMVDASLGGKTGINFGGYKNMVGSFFPASRILVAPELLETLPEREYRSGLAEVIKTAAIGDAALFRLLSAKRTAVLERDRTTVREIVRRCVRVKGSIVEQDLREHGKRAFLNLGHTFGHALESVTGFGTYSHGEAVAWGIGKALELGCALGVTNPAYADRVHRLLLEYGFPLSVEGVSPDTLLEAMRMDKKKNRDGVVFVLQKKLCDTFTQPVEPGAVRTVLI